MGRAARPARRLPLLLTAIVAALGVLAALRGRDRAVSLRLPRVTDIRPPPTAVHRSATDAVRTGGSGRPPQGPRRLARSTVYHGVVRRAVPIPRPFQPPVRPRWSALVPPPVVMGVVGVLALAVWLALKPRKWAMCATTTPEASEV